VLEIVGAGHAARQIAAVKVRQPLPALKIHANDPALISSAFRLQDQILDELNVKELQRLDDPEAYVTYTIRPNLRLLGPRLGGQLNAVRAALVELDPTYVAGRVTSGTSTPVSVGDTTVHLEPEEILVDLVRLPGFAAAQGPRSTVVLDTSLTPELIAEGLVRDFVRGVQDARKQADLKIEDTIELAYEADPEAASAIESFRDYIATETLATAIHGRVVTGLSDALQVDEPKIGDETSVVNGWHAEQIEVGDHRVRIALRPSWRTVDMKNRQNRGVSRQVQS
jgi:isoleucyl-tRNA synthetase